MTGRNAPAAPAARTVRPGEPATRRLIVSDAAVEEGPDRFDSAKAHTGCGLGGGESLQCLATRPKRLLRLLVMGLDTQMIAGSGACSNSSPAHAPDHHQPAKPALCRSPAVGKTQLILLKRTHETDEPLAGHEVTNLPPVNREGDQCSEHTNEDNHG